MDFKIQSSMPIWKQLYTKLQERIVTGYYPAGSRFPPVRELASDAAVNPNTMQRAITMLEDDGLVITNRTAGRTVTEDTEVIDETRKRLAKERLEEFLNDMKALGFSREDTAALIKEGENDE